MRHNIEFSCAAESEMRSLPSDSPRLYHESIVHFRRQLQRLVMNHPFTYVPEWFTAMTRALLQPTSREDSGARAKDGEGVYTATTVGEDQRLIL